MPIDPVIAIVGDHAPEDVMQRVRLELGLDRSLPVQFGIYVNHLLHGDLGRSVMTSNTVVEDITRYFPATIELATVAIIVATLLGVPMGVLAAVKQGTKLDQAIRVFCLAGHSVPIFLLALICLLVFYATLGWAPGTGRSDIGLEGMVPVVTGFLTIDALWADAPASRAQAAWGRRYRLWRDFADNNLAMAGLIIVVALVACAIFAPLLATHDPAIQELSNRLSELAAQDLVRARHAYTRGLLDCLPTLSHPKARLPVMGRDMITVENLRVKFGAVDAVRGVTFAVGEGQSFGIVGESGSGKSTVLRALAGLNDDWTGRMTIAGKALLTYVMVSHNLAVIAHICPQIGVMQGGEMVEMLSADDLRAGRVAHPHTADLRRLSTELEEA
eukprot:gene5817-5881_t